MSMTRSRTRSKTEMEKEKRSSLTSTSGELTLETENSHVSDSILHSREGQFESDDTIEPQTSGKISILPGAMEPGTSGAPPFLGRLPIPPRRYRRTISQSLCKEKEPVEVIELARGSAGIVVDSYKFRRDKYRKTHTSWRCCHPPCRSRCVTDSDMTHLLTYPSEHNHERVQEDRLQKDRWRTAAKKQALERYSDSAGKILHEMSSPPASSSDLTTRDKKALKNAMYRIRLKYRSPSVPRRKWTSLKPDVPTERIVEMIRERPALWQKSHPHFRCGRTRHNQLKEIALESNMSLEDTVKKVKGLKDTMRNQVAKLSRTRTVSEGQEIVWPYFNSMLFMKDEFSTNTTLYSSSLGKQQQEEEEEQEENEESFSLAPEPVDNPVKEEPPDEFSDTQHAPESPEAEQSMTLHVPPDPGPSLQHSGVPIKFTNAEATSTATTSNPEPGEVTSHSQDTDEYDAFAADIANDLRKIRDPVRLVQTKSIIRRAVEDSLLVELMAVTYGQNLNSSMNTPMDTSAYPMLNAFWQRRQQP